MIDKDDYARYLDQRRTVELVEQSMIPHALEVIRAFAKEEPDNIVFGEKVVEFTLGEGSNQDVCQMDVDLLFAPDWKVRIAAYHLEKSLAHEAWRLKCEAKMVADLEERERAELQRLLKKYNPALDWLSQEGSR